MSKTTKRQPRWASRLEAMSYGRIGSTKMNELMHAKRIVAKKLGNTVKIDLNSVDDLIESLPEVGDETAA